jgi:SanA protein
MGAAKIFWMTNKLLRMLLWIILLIIFLLAAGLAIPRLMTAFYSRARTFTREEVPVRKVAIVFGAGLWRDGRPTPVLRDRVGTAAELYFSGKVEKLLMSGDNSYLNYNEPGAMREYALELGIPDEAIVLDYAGRRTYDTCYRAKEIFGVKKAILVTQNFHLPRALYTCNQLGVDAVGVPADLRNYTRRSLIWWNVRETPATLIALWEVHIAQPHPILGEKEPIFPLEAQ